MKAERVSPEDAEAMAALSEFDEDMYRRWREVKKAEEQ
jgi:hypothetical protein